MADIQSSYQQEQFRWGKNPNGQEKKRYSTLQASGNSHNRKRSVDEQKQVVKYNGAIVHLSLETRLKIEELIRVEQESIFLGKKLKEDSDIIMIEEVKRPVSEQESKSLGKKLKEDSDIMNSDDSNDSDDSDDSSDEWSDPDPDPEEYGKDYDESDEAMERLGEEMMKRICSDQEFIRAERNLKNKMKKRKIKNNRSGKKKA